MTQPPSRIALFAFTHYWLVIALALFGLGLLGVFLVASTTTSDSGVVAIASGACFFLSVAGLAVWLYSLAHRHNALPALESTSIKVLALKKLIIVLGTITFFSAVLFGLLFIAALATPFSAPIAFSFVPYALLFEVLAAGAIAGVFFLARDRLLAAWFPVLICPHCRQQTALVNHWYCVGGCKSTRPRHVLSPCSTCGSRLLGLACSNYDCSEPISFEDAYNEFEAAHRGKKYVTQYNPFFWGAVLALEFSLFLLYIACVSGYFILGGLFGLISLALVITMIVVKPKRLTRNPYYAEGVNEWTRSATA